MMGCKEEEDAIDENIPTLHIQINGNKEVSPVLSFVQDPVTVPTELGTIEAQAEDPYCRNARFMAGMSQHGCTTRPSCCAESRL